MSRTDQPGQDNLIGRREVLALGIGAFVVASVPLLRRLGHSIPVGLTRRSLPVMGTLADLIVVHHDADLAREAIDRAFQELTRVDRTMTRFRADSDVGRANRLAASQTVRVSPETGLVIETALNWARLTNGRFDPTLGAAVELWDVTHRSSPPARELVLRLAGRALFRSIRVRPVRGATELTFQDADARLDLGGIAKGYGVDRAVAALRASGIRNGLVNVGGDLYALGHSEDGNRWKVGIRSARDPGAITRTLQLSDRAVATSGDYEQFFRHDGRRYHHLLDPNTAAPRLSEQHSLTTTAARCIHADAAATALFGASEPTIRGLLRNVDADVALA